VRQMLVHCTLLKPLNGNDRDTFVAQVTVY